MLGESVVLDVFSAVVGIIEAAISWGRTVHAGAPRIERTVSNYNSRIDAPTPQFSSIVLTYESARNSQSWDLPSSDWDHHKCGV